MSNNKPVVNTPAQAPVITKAPAMALAKEVKAASKTGVIAMATGPAKVVRTIAPKADYAAQIAALAEMIRHQNTRVDAYETQVAILTGQCETLERLIVGMQTAKAQQAAPASKAQQTAPAPAPVSATLENDSWESVLTHTAQCVRENYAADFFNEKIRPQTDCDLRVYLKTPQHRTFKIAKETAGLSLIDAVNALTKAVNG